MRGDVAARHFLDAQPVLPAKMPSSVMCVLKLPRPTAMNRPCVSVMSISTRATMLPTLSSRARAIRFSPRRCAQVVDAKINSRCHLADLNCYSGVTGQIDQRGDYPSVKRVLVRRAREFVAIIERNDHGTRARIGIECLRPQYFMEWRAFQLLAHQSRARRYGRVSLEFGFQRIAVGLTRPSAIQWTISRLRTLPLAVSGISST